MTSSGDAPSRPLAILSAPGSRGDVNPMLAIGSGLRDRGLDVVVSLAEPYAPLAEAAGLTPQSMISQQRFDQLLSAADAWKPLSGIRAILQDGGIGTTAQAIDAGCPQLILPMAFDQFHNAEQVVRLGLGDQLLRPTAAKLQQTLDAVLQSPQLPDRCAVVAQRLRGRDGSEVAADQIVALLRR